jgi:hypothetical protein
MRLTQSGIVSSTAQITKLSTSTSIVLEIVIAAVPAAPAEKPFADRGCKSLQQGASTPSKSSV